MPPSSQPTWKPIGTYRTFPLPLRPLTFPYTPPSPLTQTQVDQLVARLYPQAPVEPKTPQQAESPVSPGLLACRAEPSRTASSRIE